MYFWNIEGLKDDLKNGLSESDKFKYLLVTVFLYWLVFFFPVSENSILLFVENLVNIILSILVVYLFYLLNGKNLGKNLMERYVSMNFVIWIRAFVFSFPVLLFLVISEYFILDFFAVQSIIIETLVYYVYLISYYAFLIFMLNKHLTSLRASD